MVTLTEAPQTIFDTKLSRVLLEELTLRTLSFNGEMSLAELAEQTCLSLPVIEELFQFFRREQLVEVKGMTRGTHVVATSFAGKERVTRGLDFSAYSGPAPVSLDDYRSTVLSQSVQQTAVRKPDLERAFSKLVLEDELVSQIGAGVISGTSIFLYGPPGTGKTTLGCNIPAIFGDSVLIPYAIEVDHQIIPIYDPTVHHPCGEKTPDDRDSRWVLCKRPRVVAGGELSFEMLELQLSRNSRLFTAPLQLKANNGVLVLDDFGRQRVRSEELLNRWMMPLDRRIDFLALPGGKKFEVPFDVLVIFSTNLDPRQLADDAFLRRIPNKIHVKHANAEQFKEIFERECQARALACEGDLADYLVELITIEMKQPLAHGYVRDLINQILWSATYLGVEPSLSKSTLERACHSYFLSVG